MTKLTKMRSSGFQGQVSVRTPSFPAPCPASWVWRVWGEPFLGREAPGLRHLPKELLPASPGLLMAESHRPVLLLWRQEVRTGSKLLMSFRFPKAILPRDVPLEPLGAG